jgi:hypothetical protein
MNIVSKDVKLDPFRVYIYLYLPTDGYTSPDSLPSSQ